MEKYSFFKFFNRDLKNLQNYQIDQILSNKKNYRKRILDQDSFNLKYPFLNLEFYRNNYFDLNNLNRYELMYHYHFNGRKENRICNITQFKKKYPKYEEELKNVNLKLISLILGNKININEKTQLYIYLKLKLPSIFYLNNIKNDILKLRYKNKKIENCELNLEDFKNCKYTYDKLTSCDFKRLDYRIIKESECKSRICHIHLSENFNYNKVKIDTLNKNFSIIFTYSNRKVQINNEGTYINLDFKGGKFGGQMVCINYLKKKNIDFTSILFLDDDLDIFQVTGKIESILSNFEENNDVKIIFDHLDYESIQNKYVEEIFSLWNMPLISVKNKGFILIKKEIIENVKLSEDLFFTLMNDYNSIDINWITNYYNLQHLEIDEIKKNIDTLKLDTNAYQKKTNISFMFEDFFNYLWINIAHKKNFNFLVKEVTPNLKNLNLLKNFKIIDLKNVNDFTFQNNITENFLNDNKVISIKDFYRLICSIKTNNVNVIQIFNNLFNNHKDVIRYFKNIDLDFTVIKDNIKRICDDSMNNFKEELTSPQYLINKLVNDFDVNVYKIFNLDLSNYSDEKLLEQWILYGFYEGRIYSLKKFNQIYPEFSKKKMEESKSQVDKIFRNFFKNLDENYLYKYQLVYHYMNINNISFLNNNITSKQKKVIRIALLIHCGNYNIFTEIYKDYPDLFNVSHIYISCHNYEVKGKLNSKFKNATVIVCENKGMDIGGRLKIIDYINKASEEFDYYISIHTKTDKDWRDKMLKPLNHMIKNINKFETSELPRIYSSFNNIYPNYKLINTKNIIKILKRNKIYTENVSNYFDQLYPNDYYMKNNEVNFYGGLFPNDKFYSYYEDLDIQHYYKNGLTEFHRIANVNYIKSFTDKNTNFVAGTCFICNKSYFNIFKRFKDLTNEFEELERGKVFNKREKKTHSWEYLFGLLCYINNGDIVDIYSNNIVTNKRDIKKYSVINVPFYKSDIAFSMIIPNGEFISGGYRTLLKYINYLNKQGKSVDIYFGECWDDKDLILNYNSNNHGMPSCLNWFQKDINYYVDLIKKFNVIDISKNNFYVGLNFQKPYKYGVANAWQTAHGVYKNLDKCDDMIYIIQDREYLFYDDVNLIKEVKSTYYPEFKYYYLSKYLCNYFQKIYNFPNYVESHLSADSNIYFDLKLKREEKVILFYYPDKKGRMSELIKEIVTVLTKNKIYCIVLPFNFKYESKHIEFLEAQKPQQLNELYNNCKVGIVFSNTNPSRLSYEMFFAGLNVIEYDSEFTKYDVSNEYFTKINTSSNIVNIVKELFYKNNNEKRNNFIKKYGEINELDKFLNYLD